MVRAEIIHPVTGEVLDTCLGPDEQGECLRAAADGTVACAGRVLQAEAPEVGWSTRLSMSHLAMECPLRGFVIEGDSED